MDMSMLSGGTIAINIMGREFDTLEKIARDVAEIVSSVEGTADVSDGIEDTAPELRIVVDKEKSIARGLTVAQVFMEINKLLAGETVATSISIENKDYDVLVKDEREKSSIMRSDIMDFKIASPQGEKVAIKDIALIEEARGFSAINRTNQQRYVTVRAELEEGYNIGLVSNQINSKLAVYQAPEGYSIEMSGERKMISETFRDLLFMLLIAIAFIYLIMVAQFQSLLSPFIIMFTIPLAFTGGFLALIITGNPVSTISFIGLIILAGVVVNNGIVFVDYVNKMREDGMNKKDAIYKAGNDRIRPIFMTALTTVFGLSTISAGAGMGTEIIQPMAITAIGGLVYATFLTLILVPVLYDSFHKSRD
jgi:multidrug efflux pump subunit AcrB